jgi:DHA3 family tetracycline resistance protein-like MFS transporter
MPETAFRRSVHYKQNPARNLPLALQETIRLVRRQPLLPGFLAIALLFGMYIEAFDRLGDAHFLLNFNLPAWGDRDSVLWFGIIAAGSQVLGFMAAGVAVRWHVEQTTIATVHMVSVLQLLWIVCAFGFAVAPTFALALLAYWTVAVISTVQAPFYDTWVNQHLESSTRATSLSVINQADALGQLVGGPAIGVVGTVYSLRMALVVAALMLSPILLIYRWALSTYRSTVSQR